MLAREALRLIGANIETAVFDGDRLEARSAMLLGSMLAGQAFANSPVAAVHALAYPIGGSFHVPHGLSNALVLPHVLRFNMVEAPVPYAEIAADAFPALAGEDGSQARDRRLHRRACIAVGKARAEAAAARGRHRPAASAEACGGRDEADAAAGQQSAHGR